jgi:hypothetical protein
VPFASPVTFRAAAPAPAKAAATFRATFAAHSVRTPAIRHFAPMAMISDVVHGLPLCFAVNGDRAKIYLKPIL